MRESIDRMFAVRKLVAKLRPDVVVGSIHSVYLRQGLALLGSGVPVVASEHTVFDHYRTVPLQSLLMRLMPLVATKITVVSERVKRSFPPSVRRRMTVIPNPVRRPG